MEVEPTVRLVMELVPAPASLVTLAQSALHAPLDTMEQPVAKVTKNKNNCSFNLKVSKMCSFIACGCTPGNSLSSSCDTSLNCNCNAEFAQPQCSTCSDGYYGANCTGEITNKKETLNIAFVLQYYDL